jgi:Kef-type K+ transport system membrane component KefB
MSHELLHYALPPLVLALFVWRAAKRGPRKLRIRSMWVMPAVIAVGAAAALASAPAPGVKIWFGYAFALVFGLMIGRLRARHMDMQVDYETGHVTTKATPIGIILVIALFALRYALKLIFPQLSAQPGGHLAGSALIWTDAALLFSCGLVWGRVVMLWLRARLLRLAHESAAR